jgi:heme exporter protein D
MLWLMAGLLIAVVALLTVMGRRARAEQVAEDRDRQEVMRKYHKDKGDE